MNRVCKERIILGIDASRNRSGGAIAHLRGLLGAGNPTLHGITMVHLWAHDVLLDGVSERPWLIKHRVPSTRRSIWCQLQWQRFALPRIARHLSIDVIFNTDAGSVCPFQPSATLSQDMLSFEPGEMQRYPLPQRARLRLEALKIIQLFRLRRSSLAIFLSDHAGRVISRLVPLPRSVVIPHGVDTRFSVAADRRRLWPQQGSIRCLYVSNAAPYKHQWHVIEAIARLRAESGRDLRLRLVGGGAGRALARLHEAMAKHDPDHAFVELIDFVPNDVIVDELASADLFIYASSCENLPITLLEAMASGLVIASSNRGPMPEVLGDGGTYFDPEDPGDIAVAVSRLLRDSALRQRVAAKARSRAEIYSWESCAAATWSACASIAMKDR